MITNRRYRRLSDRIILYALLSCLALIFLMPPLFMISTGLKSPVQLYNIPIKWFDRPLQWVNFLTAWRRLSFLTFLRNTLLVSILSVAGHVLSCSFVGFGFSRMKFPGRDILFLVLLGTILIPPQVTVIPLFLFYIKINWIDTFFPLIVPNFFGSLPFYIFLMRQYMLSIPPELEDAAQIDGCSWLQIYSRIFLPLCKPALAAVGVLTFLYHWNDFFEPLVFLNSTAKKTLTLGIVLFQGQYADQEIQLLMAMAALIALPPILIFFFAQRYFVRGIALTGIKE